MRRQQFIMNIESIQRPLRRFLKALCCGDASLADDLAQDTLVKAYLASDNFRGECKFSTWIFRIAVNTFISSRRNVRHGEVLDVADNILATECSDSSFEYQALYQALAKLSEKERSVILLHYLQGYSVSEIAEITDATGEAVRKQLSRGRNHLRAFLID